MDNTDNKCFKYSELHFADLQIKASFSLSSLSSLTVVHYFLHSEVRQWFSCFQMVQLVQGYMAEYSESHGVHTLTELFFQEP